MAPGKAESNREREAFVERFLSAILSKELPETLLYDNRRIRGSGEGIQGFLEADNPVAEVFLCLESIECRSFAGMGAFSIFKF